MTGSTPPAGSSGNTSQHFDLNNTATPQNPMPPAPTITLAVNNGSITDLDHFRNDINAMRSCQNDKRVAKRLANETTSDDEELLSDTNLISTRSKHVTPPSLNISSQLSPTNNNTDLTISTSTHTSNSPLSNDTPPTSSNTPTSSPTINAKPVAFTGDIAKKNEQLEMLKTIPDQILTMVRE
ncbi:hypothetical protein K439DRAFT_1615690 [Ramaria rubella]|nr:hypothetical protein K439DRAFT_1615690 [Ramaria rubella]